MVRKPSRLLAFAARSGKFPCIFPCIREFELRESFAEDCQHSHTNQLIRSYFSLTKCDLMVRVS